MECAANQTYPKKIEESEHFAEGSENREHILGNLLQGSAALSMCRGWVSE